MKAIRRVADGLQFVIVCRECGERMELENEEAALLAGWTAVASLPRCKAANFSGTCCACSQTLQEGAEP